MKARQFVGLAGLLSIVLLVPPVAGGLPPVVKALSPAYVQFAGPNAGWEEVGSSSASGGGISDNNGGSYAPSVSTAPDGTPYVAWDDDSGGTVVDIYIRRWNGNSWEEVGLGSAAGRGISDSSGWSMHPSVAIAPDGTPYVAWYDATSGDSEIYVRRWNGNSWEEVGLGSASGGGISDNSGGSHDPSLAVALGGTPYVAWKDGSGWDEEIYVRRWTPPIYLPIVLKPPPTYLYVQNETTGTVSYKVNNTPQGDITCSIPAKTTKYCGSFTPGTYWVELKAWCGPWADWRPFPPGAVTRTVECR
jgi:hypothetical protein